MPLRDAIIPYPHQLLMFLEIVPRSATYAATFRIERPLPSMHPAPQVLTPLKAIRSKCLDCCCGSFQEVRNCTLTTCTLWPYRAGHRPSTAARKAAKKEDNEPN